MEQLWGQEDSQLPFMHMMAGLFMSLVFSIVTIGVNLRKLKIDVTVAQSFLIKHEYGRHWH